MRVKGHVVIYKIIELLFILIKNHKNILKENYEMKTSILDF